MPTAAHASLFWFTIRKATHTVSPVAARPRWAKITGTGSLLGATPCPVTSFSMSHTASMNRPSKTVANQVITVAKPTLSPICTPPGTLTAAGRECASRRRQE
jgi:hypothetical protein